mgnify:CR=1 FL=1
MGISVATAPTACGIETTIEFNNIGDYTRLQQHLPLAVLKQQHYY